jgi:hypothetical protein
LYTPRTIRPGPCFLRPARTRFGGWSTMERKSGSSAACLGRRADCEKGCLQAGHCEGEGGFWRRRERGRAARSWWRKALEEFMGREEAWYYYFLILVMMSLDLGGLKFIYGTCRCTSPGSGVFAESRPRLSMERYAFNKGRAAKH